MDCSDVRYSGHAVRQMFARSVSTFEVEAVVRTGNVIAEYADDQPYPSRLVLGVIDGRPLHVVVALNAADRSCIVVTVYEPDPALWDDEFTHRRNS